MWRLGEREGIIRGVTPNGGDIDHAVTEFDEGSAKFYQFPALVNLNTKRWEKLIPLNRNIQIRDVMQNEARHLLVLFLAQPLDEVVARQGLSESVGGEAVLGETVVKQIDHFKFVSWGILSSLSLSLSFLSGSRVG